MAKSNKTKFIDYGVFGANDLAKTFYKMVADKQRGAVIKKAGKAAMEFARRKALEFCPIFTPDEHDNQNWDTSKVVAGALKQSISMVRVKYNGVVIPEKLFDKKGRIKTKYKQQLYSYVQAGSTKSGVDYAPRVEWGRNGYIQFIPYINKDGALDRKTIYVPPAPPQPFMGDAIKFSQARVVATFGRMYCDGLLRIVLRKLSKKQIGKVNSDVAKFIKDGRKYLRQSKK